MAAIIQKTQVYVVAISLLIQIALSQVGNIASSDVDLKWSTLQSLVRITNRLGDGSTLNLHCKSKDDNLGLQIVAPNGSWSFKFRPNIWGSTVFSCHFTWPRGHSTHFDIYDDSRDGVRKGIPCIYCFWDISKDGPCRFNDATEAFDICYYWNGERKE
ncbi:hypothetical protein EUTSA_v10015390mg [Eutrema salsugineum]|uniref:S-protein homolog n=1 Tax=Eutrema salsugineum TaxID=72664 RepID=V4N6H6_EUTSA|nr:S-protein homolog 4 [Eutrema salsugineum]ESQ41176.1 hypothetical protein EUTSA_v10015390mg [Eutrema salsugineum]